MKSIAELTGLNLNDDRRLVNHSVRRTAIQILKDNDVPEDEIIKFSGHRSREGVRAYKNPNEQQLIRNTAMLLKFDFETTNLEEFEYYPGDLGVNYCDNDYDDENNIEENESPEENMLSQENELSQKDEFDQANGFHQANGFYQTNEFMTAKELLSLEKSKQTDDLNQDAQGKKEFSILFYFIIMTTNLIFY